MTTAFPAAPDAIAWRALLTALLAAACVTDVRARRIPNALVLALLAAAFVRVAAAPAAAGLAAGPGSAALGAVAGLALWVPLYAAGAFGAGDVKLFAACAAWLGPAGVPGATLYAAVAGGALALAWIGARRLASTVPMLASNLQAILQPTDAGRSRVPYGVAIAAGVLCDVWGLA